MTPPASKNPIKHLRASDLRGVAQLATQATAGVTRITEGVHQAVWSALGAPDGKVPGQTGGITGLVYKSIQGATQLLGKGVDTLFARLQPLLESAEAARPGTPQREAVLAALNGVMGDRLAASNNPLAIPMTLRYQGEALNWQALPPGLAVTGKVLLLIHGLCMNDLQWHTWYAGEPAQEMGHGAALAARLGYTPIYLRYNTGLHISQNGHELSSQLEQLVAHWPVPIDEFTVVAHSMGGLVIRSAVYYGRQDALRWPARLSSIVFLGTPHHGAPLERAGNWIDVILGRTPFSAPFVRLTRLRSAGITDLRYGYVLDVDWQGQDLFRPRPDSRKAVPLPEGVACYAVAGTTAAKRSALADRLVGDGLVPLNSALGQHDDRRRSLVFAKASQWIAYRTSHMALLSNPAVTQQLVRWLTPPPPS
ncbi:MAG: alpha/beta hydrolase [Rhodoferax sp.]|nr:alpha/beta hydrolase [Rhodoferax sp.]